MTDVANRSVISLELDDTNLRANAANITVVYREFIARLQAAANITPTIDMDQWNNNRRFIVRVPVDPNTTTAGLEVVNEIIKEYTQRFRREARVTVGVDTQKVRTAFTELRDYAVRTGSSIADGMYFWISRGLLKIGRDLLKSPFTAFAAAFSKGIEAEESTKKLAKALGTTGEQAGKTIEELAEYARQLEKITNVANEAVQGVQALLAPSKGLSGVNFDRATKGALDLAAALGGDINSHAERLAKSLQDPVRGMEMLRDAGISFTQEQQDIIKLFSETNRVGDAQSIMLDELESRYLGAADSTGDLSDKVKQAELHYENFKERIGEVIVEMKSEFIPAIDEAMAKLDGLTPVAAGAATALANIAISILNLRDNTDAATMSTEEIALKTSEWASALEGAYGSMDGIVDNALTNLNDYIVMLSQASGITAALVPGAASREARGLGLDPEQTDFFGSKARSAKRAEEIEQAAIDRRAKKKKQDELDAAQRKEDAVKRKADQEKEIALGTGLVTEDEIAKKGAKQAIKDAKEAQDKERKKLLADNNAAKKAVEDADRAARRAARAAQDADDDKARADKRAAREAEAAEDKRMKEEERARAKAQADYEKSLGRDSLLAMHDRIQDGAFLLRGDLEEKQKITTASRTVDKKSQEDKNPAQKPTLVADPTQPGKPNALTGASLGPQPLTDRQAKEAKTREEEAKIIRDAEERLAKAKKDHEEVQQPGSLSTLADSDANAVRLSRKRTLEDRERQLKEWKAKADERQRLHEEENHRREAAKEAKRQPDLLQEFMPNTRKATNALGQKTAPTQKQKDAAEQEAFLAGFAPRGKAGSTKLEVKQDDVVQAVDKTEKAITTMGNNIVKAIKEPTKMGP